MDHERPETPHTPGSPFRRTSTASELRVLRAAFSDRHTEVLSGTSHKVAGKALQWGSQKYCETLLVGTPALANFPDGADLLASLLYPVRNSAVTAEAACALANLAFYAPDGATQDALLSSGVIQELVKALQWCCGRGATSSAEDVAQYCCLALADLCLNSSARRNAAIQAGAAAAVAELLRLLENNDTDAYREAHRAAVILACEASGRQMLAKAVRPKDLLRLSLNLKRGEEMRRRSQNIFDERESQGHDQDRRHRTAPSSVRTGQLRTEPRHCVLPAAKEELQRLRWHRGDWDGVKPTADCTGLMPCKGAIRKSSVYLSDRKMMATSKQRNSFQRLMSAGYSEFRDSPAHGDSLILCLVFTWLELLLDHPVGMAEAAEGEEKGRSPREKHAALYKNCVDKMNSGVSRLDFPLQQLAALGHLNLVALIDGLCETEQQFSSNELADVLSGSLRFTYSIVVFLRAAASVAIQRDQEAAVQMLVPGGALSGRDLKALCARHVEPLGADTRGGLVHLVLNALAGEMHTTVCLQDYDSDGASVHFPMGKANNASAHETASIHLGFVSFPSPLFRVLYLQQPRHSCPHFRSVREWASSRAERALRRRPPFSVGPKYPPRPGMQTRHATPQNTGEFGLLSEVKQNLMGRLSAMDSKHAAAGPAVSLPIG